MTGRPVVRYDASRTKTIRIPSLEHARPTATVPRPAAYLIPAGFANVEERLKAHGIRYEKLPAARTLAVGTYRASAPVFAKASYQGRVRVEATIARAVETRTLPAGSLYVPLDTELANVAIALLEPESPDSLFAWGELSACLEEKEYMDTRVLDPLAEEMLAKDPKLKAEWERKLQDPKFAGDARARHRFFYERTPFFDETVGLVPVFRLDAPLSVSGAPGGAAFGRRTRMSRAGRPARSQAAQRRARPNGVLPGPFGRASRAAVGVTRVRLAHAAQALGLGRGPARRRRASSRRDQKRGEWPSATPHAAKQMACAVSWRSVWRRSSADMWLETRITCGGPYVMTPPVARRAERTTRAGGSFHTVGESVVAGLQRRLLRDDLGGRRRLLEKEVELPETRRERAHEDTSILTRPTSRRDAERAASEGRGRRRRRRGPPRGARGRERAGRGSSPEGRPSRARSPRGRRRRATSRPFRARASARPSPSANATRYACAIARRGRGLDAGPRAVRRSAATGIAPRAATTGAAVPAGSFVRSQP